MTCEKCGANIKEGEQLCHACKAGTAANKVASEYAKKLRSLLNTPVYYVAVIATLFSMFFRVARAFSVSNISVTLADAMMQMENAADLSSLIDRISGFMNQFGGIAVVLGMLTQIPLLLETIGLLFLTVYIIRGKGPQGLNLVRAGIMIDVIYLAILAMIAVLGCIFGLVAGNYAGDGFLNLMVVFTVVTAVIFILIFCYKGALIRLTDFAESALSAKRHPGSGPSSFLVGMTFITAVLSLLSMLLIFVFPASSAPGMIFSAFGGHSMTTIIINICSVLSVSLFGVLLSQVRKIPYEPVRKKAPMRKNAPQKRPPRQNPRPAPQVTESANDASASE